MKLPSHVPLVVATRGDRVESVFYGSIAVVDRSGRLLHGIGDPQFPVFTRSTLKPFQALPFLLDGGPGHFGFSREQVALLCASHSGEPRHVAAVADMLARAGSSEADLQCGRHPPLFYSTHDQFPPADLKISALHHNCSGKHAGFLAWCRQHGEPVESYLAPDHPLQAAIRHSLAQVIECEETALPSGIDGCSAPNYALPLARLAWAYGRLANPTGTEAFQGALETLFDAMTACPEMVSGQGRGDLLLMNVAPGDWVAKAGADGVQALGIRSLGLGIALKIADGSPRAVQVAISSTLEQLGLWPEDAPPGLQPWRQGEIRNYVGRLTGRLLPVFDLKTKA